MRILHWKILVVDQSYNTLIPIIIMKTNGQFDYSISHV